MKWLLSFVLITVSSLAFGQQLVINSNMLLVAARGSTIATTFNLINQSTNTDLQNVDLVLASTGPTPQFIRTNTPLSVNGLTINSKATFALSGEWVVLNKLTLTEGNLFVDRSASIPGRLAYSGTADLEGNDKSYVNGRIFVQGVAGARTFPIGNVDGYFPVRLETVSAADQAIPLGFEVIRSNPTDAPASFVISPDVKDIFSERYWEFSVGGTGTFSGNTTLSVSNNKADQFGSTEGDVTILEKSSIGDQKDLGGAGGNAFITSGVNISATGKYYALAKTDEIKIRIRKLITPDNDGTNEVLVIDGIDSSPNNKVTLIDRWGVPVKVWDGFKNYPEPAGPDQDFDFSKLAIGNYICVAEYDDRGVRKNKKQMISVLK